MFGKPQWFRPKTFGWGLVPVAWQGWLYTGGWLVAIGFPFFVLLGRHQALEAMAWLGVATGALAYDVGQILGALRGPRGNAATSPPGDDKVLYILDSQLRQASQPGQPVATRNYKLQVRG
jgi:hypothetical protein